MYLWFSFPEMMNYEGASKELLKDAFLIAQEFSSPHQWKPSSEGRKPARDRATACLGKKREKRRRKEGRGNTINRGKKKKSRPAGAGSEQGHKHEQRAAARFLYKKDEEIGFVFHSEEKPTPHRGLLALEGKL